MRSRISGLRLTCHDCQPLAEQNMRDLASVQGSRKVREQIQASLSNPLKPNRFVISGEGSMKIIKAVQLPSLRKLTTILVASALLLVGFFGVASATSSQPPTTPGTNAEVVNTRTQHVNADSPRVPGTKAAISTRVLWCGISGDFHLNVTGLGAFDGQPVAVTVVEAGTGGSEGFGLARMRVNNVSVWGGNVTAWVTVEWSSPLCIWTHYVAI